jgi:hypothetical protein
MGDSGRGGDFAGDAGDLDAVAEGARQQRFRLAPARRGVQHEQQQSDQQHREQDQRGENPAQPFRHAAKGKAAHQKACPMPI